MKTPARFGFIKLSFFQKIAQWFGRQIFFVLAALLSIYAFAELSTLKHWSALDNSVGDAMMKVHAAQRKAPESILMVNLDQDSISDLQMVDIAGGAWPWPRMMHGELIEWLVKQEPKAIVFDFVINARDLERPQSDAVFHKALRHPNVFIPMVVLNNDKGDVRMQALSNVPEITGLRPLPGADKQPLLPIAWPMIPDEVMRTGHISFINEKDGISRYNETGRVIDNWWVPSMAGRVAEYLKLPPPPQHRFRLNFYNGNFDSVPYNELYKATQSRNVKINLPVKDRIVIVGPTAPGLLDFRPTAISSVTPGPHILATAIGNLQNGDWLDTTPTGMNVALCIVLIFSLASAFALRLGTTKVTIGFIVICVACILMSWVLMGRNTYWMPISTLSLAAVALMLFALVSSRLESVHRAHVQSMFNRFLDPRVVDALAVGEGGFSNASLTVNREITIVFSDLRGFTTMSEHRKPEEIFSLLNNYFELQVDVIFKRGGTLDKFIGDAIMAFWNAPFEQKNHAVLAVEAAIDMGMALEEFRKNIPEGFDPEKFEIGIGVHTGPANVGFLGTEKHRLDYTAIGDTVNLGSRIEGCTKGVSRILISEPTKNACGDAFDYVDHGDFEVKGREQKVRLFEPVRRMK